MSDSTPLIHRYTQAQFLKSAARVDQLPTDSGFEVAFAGRSNAGKSSALNCLTANKRLARTSKTPGRTQLINLFVVKDPEHRLVDLPGYGYAKVSLSIKLDWQKHLAHYLEVRQSLRGLVLLMDCRHPLMESDRFLIQWAEQQSLPLHILLTKADKLSRSQSQQALDLVRKYCKSLEGEHDQAQLMSMQVFSSLKKQGLAELVAVLDHWFEWS